MAQALRQINDFKMIDIFTQNADRKTHNGIRVGDIVTALTDKFEFVHDCVIVQLVEKHSVKFMDPEGRKHISLATACEIVERIEDRNLMFKSGVLTDFEKLLVERYYSRSLAKIVELKDKQIYDRDIEIGMLKSELDELKDSDANAKRVFNLKQKMVELEKSLISYKRMWQTELAKNQANV